MRLLLINGNTSEAMTARIAAEAQRIATRGTSVIAVTARFGAAYVATRAAYAIAAHAALDAYAEHGAEADAIVLACFGDPGLFALREVARVPIVGMAEASCRMAAPQGKRIAIVTGGSGWVAMLREFVAAIGFADEVVAIRAVAPTGAEIAADPERARAILAAECRAAVAEDGADVVILGGAGLIGIADAIAGEVPVPIIDSLTAAVRIAEAHAGVPSPAAAKVVQPVEWTGLSLHLSELLSP